MNEQCPECDGADTERVHKLEYADEIEIVYICNECPTEWTLAFANPVVRNVRQYE